jgi:hypothetical protein
MKQKYRFTAILFVKVIRFIYIHFMKTIFLGILSLSFYGSVSAQCPSAGQDSTAVYCKNELFDVAELRSDDADISGVFIDPAGDTMTTTVISLMFPGQYSYFYHVSDTTCPVDTAKYVIVIQNCWPWGLAENVVENNAIIRINPVSDQLVIHEIPFDFLEIYDTSGRRVLILSGSANTVIDVSQLKSGNYILILSNDGIKQFQRFLKY